MNHLSQVILISFLAFISLSGYSQVSVANLQKAIDSAPSAIPTIFKGYKKEHTDKTGNVYYGNVQNSNTIAIDHRQGTNIVFYGFDNKKIFDLFYNEIDKISLEYGCDLVTTMDDDLNPIKIKCECNGYFYYLNTFIYNNIVAGYEIKVAKSNNKDYILKQEE